MNSTVYDFLDIFTESGMQEVAIFDVTSGEEIARGTRDELPSDVQNMEIMSIDNLDGSNVLTLNVEAELNDVE